jgi:hypothetical protein
MSDTIISGTLNIGSGVPYDIVLSETSGNRTVFNKNNKDVDFAISGNNSFIYYDASTDRLGIGVDDPDTSLHIIAPCANDGLKIEGTTNCATGVRVLLLHNPGVTASSGSFPSTIDLAGQNTNGQTIYYGQIRSKILDPITSKTSGELLFNVDVSGSPSTVFRANYLNAVLGGLNTTNGSNYNVFGSRNNFSGVWYIDLGSNNNGTITSGLLLGNSISTTGSKTITIGNLASLTGNNIVLIGNNTSTTGHNNILIVNDSKISGSNSIILGNNTIIKNGSDNTIGLLNNSTIHGLSGIGFGSLVNSTGNSNLFLGNKNIIVGSDNSIIGSFIAVTGSDNLLYGSDTSINGSHIVSIGSSNSSNSITSGLLIGNNIDLANTTGVIVLGLGNSTLNGLTKSILIGISNDTSAGNATNLVMVGQNNVSADITNSLIVGNNNDASGTVKNTVLLGPNNYSPTTSNNNIIVGALNNNSGLSIVSNGTISGISSRVNGNINNSLIFGIQNIGHNATNVSLLGNKNYISGINTNVVGSFNNLKNVDGVQNIGNSNFILGTGLNIFGGKSTVIGSSSIINNPSRRSVYSFGSGNILFGDNEIVISGLCIGDRNDLLGPHNIVYGTNNFIGETRNPCLISSSTITIAGDVRANYTEGDRVLVVVINPASSNNIYQRLIDTEGVIYDNVGGVTILSITEGITPYGLSYETQPSFDAILSAPATNSGWVMPYQNGNDLTDLILNPLYGNNNIVIGRNNRYLNNSGIILGANTRTTGVQNIVIGHNITGNYNNSVQIGTNNANKIYFDNDGVIFNTGINQNHIIFNSRLQGTTLKADLAQNRVGILTSSPRSALDVSGTITTNGLRVGLSTTAGYSLIADSNGNATWQFPVNLSGIDTGMLYRVNSKVASGIEELRFIANSKHLGYLKPGTNDPEVLEDAFTLTPSGLFINNSSDDESLYNVVIKGSGIGITPGQQDYTLRINLFKTLPQYNAVQVYNITGISGHFYRHTVTDSMFLPKTLTGTFLSVNGSNGLLSAQIMPNNTVLFGNRQSLSSGNNDLKFFSENKALTIGSTGVLTQEQTLNFQGETDGASNVILCSTANFGSVINNAGNSRPFSVIDFGRASINDRQGMHYWTSGGVLGIGVTPGQTMQSTNNGSLTSWYTHSNVKLSVNGKIKTNGLQITPNGAFPGDASARYLKADDNGNVTLSAITLSTQFSGIWPVYANAEVASRVDFGISTRADGSNTNYGASQNGFLLSYNGSRWVNNSRGLRAYQPDYTDADNDTIPGLILGPDGRTNSCKNTHVFAGTAFMDVNTDSRYVGSSQLSRFYLKGRTAGASNTELVSDFTKNAVSSASSSNTISIQYLYDPATSNNYPSYNGVSVWMYRAQFCGLVAPLDGNNVETTTYKGIAGSLQGAFLFYRGSNNTRTITQLGSPTITYYKTSDLVWNEDPIYVTGIGTDNVQRLGIYTRGLSNNNILWNTTVDIQQINHPSGLTIGGQF